MYGDKWWGYLHDNGVVTVSPQDPRYFHDRRTSRVVLGQANSFHAVTKVVGPVTEDLADELEGDIKMVRRKIMAALYDKPLEELLHD